MAAAIKWMSRTKNLQKDISEQAAWPAVRDKGMDILYQQLPPVSTVAYESKQQCIRPIESSVHASNLICDVPLLHLMLTLIYTKM